MISVNCHGINKRLQSQTVAESGYDLQGGEVALVGLQHGNRGTDGREKSLLINSAFREEEIASEEQEGSRFRA